MALTWVKQPEHWLHNNKSPVGLATCGGGVGALAEGGATGCPWLGCRAAAAVISTLGTLGAGGCCAGCCGAGRGGCACACEGGGGWGWGGGRSSAGGLMPCSRSGGSSFLPCMPYAHHGTHLQLCLSPQLEGNT